MFGVAYEEEDAENDMNEYFFTRWKINKASTRCK